MKLPTVKHLPDLPKKETMSMNSMRTARAGLVLALAGAVAAMPLRSEVREREAGILDANLERMPGSGATRTDFGPTPCAIKAPLGGCAGALGEMGREWRRG